MGAVRERFPLFPLPVVVLPHEVAPLHIFEERYKLMIGECVEHERDFGILWLSDAGLRDVGCTVAVTEVVDRLEDGRLNILIAGRSPFRLLRRIGDMAYPAGDVELLDDEHDEAAEDDAGARERYADLVERVTDERPGADDLDGLDAYAMAATVELSPDVKQGLLELRSEPERLRRVAKLFREALGRIDEAERIGDIARTNGKGR